MGNESVPENRVAANLVKYLSSCQGNEEVSKQWLQLNSGLEPEALKRKMKAKIMDIQQRHRALYGTAVLVHEQTTQLLRCSESLLKHTEHPVNPSDSGFLFVEWILEQRSLTASAEETIKSAITLLHVCRDYVSGSPFASSNNSNIPEENRSSNPAADSFAKCSGTTVESTLEKKYADGVRSGKWVSAVPESPKLETPDTPRNRSKNESSQSSQDAKRPSPSLDKLHSSQEDTPKSLNLMDSDEHPEPSKKKRRRAVRMLQDLTEKDAWEWRKYGQKPIKDSPLFRSYYRCNRSKEGCKAKKMVDHHALDSTPARVFVEGEHSHPPVAYNASKLLEAVTSDFHCDNDGSNCTIDDEKENSPGKRDELLDRSVSDKDVRSGLVFDFMGVGPSCGGIMQKVPKSEMKMEVNGSVISVENGY